MDGREDLEQQLWEFVYELLPEDEAEAVRGRIAAEPDVARVHDDVRRKAAIVAQAAKLELPPIPLVQPAARARPSSRRWTNWVVALAASLLLCYLGFAGLRTRSLERSVADAASGTAWADQPIRTVVFGPTAVQPAQANYFAVQTQTAAGAPRAAAVNYRVIGDDGTLLTRGQFQSDASGFAQFHFLAATPSGPGAARQLQNVSLELEPQTTLPPVTVRRTLPLATPQLTTYLSVDKTVYRPGERVRCRSVTLDRASLDAIRDVPVKFHLLDADGQPLSGANRDALTQHGVAWADFELPRFQPSGTYTLIASNPTGVFPEASHEFEVRPYVAPALRQQRDSARDSCDPADERLASGQGGIRVEFRPESGELVHGVSNRVYVFAHDARDKPIHIQGHVADSQGRQVALVQTIHDGRGVFALQPEPEQAYRLELEPASGTVEQPELPPVSQRQFLALNAAPGVFAAGQPLKVRLRSNAIRPVAVSAACRGLVVGQEFVSPTEFSRAADPEGLEVVIPVADSAEGVIRVTAYDYGTRPPEPVAERLVFRRPTRQLQIRPGQDIGSRQPGESVELAFSVQNERGRPLQAVLGASVVDDAALSLVGDHSASLTTHFWLTGQIDDVRGLEDASLYLAEGPQAEQALDLLLGTQGWRRFVSFNAGQFAQVPAATQADQSLFFDDQDSLAAATIAVSDSPAVLIDNVVQASEAVRSGLASLQTAYQGTVRRAGMVVIVGSLILAVALGLLAVLRRLPAAPVWMPALSASAICLVLGFAWLATETRPGRAIATASVARSAGEVQVARVEQVDENAAPDGLEAAASPFVPEMGQANSAATDGWYRVENVVGKGASMGGAIPPPAEPAAAVDFASPTADGLERQAPAAEVEKRKDSDFDKSRWDAGQVQRVDESQEPPSRAGRLPERGDQADEEALQDMPVPNLHVQSVDAARPLARDPSPVRGGGANRASSTEGRSEPARRLKGAPPAAPSPAPAPAAPAEADKALTESMGAPRGAIQAPQAAPAAPPMPAAAQAFGVEAEEKPAASAEVLAESLPKEAASSQLQLETKAGPAADQIPAGQSQLASDAPAAAGGPAGGMGGAGYSFGGGAPAATASAPAPSRDSRTDLKQQVAEQAAPLAALPVPAVELAPAKPAETTESFAKREALARGQTIAAPAGEQLFFRQYGRRSLGELSADERAAPLETVCWEPLLVTDAEGRTTIRFRLPETATTYRVLVDAHAPGRIGSYLGRIVVRPESSPRAD